MFPKSRREFLQLSASAAAAATWAKSSPLWSQAIAAPRPLKVWITYDAQKFAPVEAPKWTATANKESERVHIDPTTWYQEILGFGGLLPMLPATCFTS
jgi:hypothetical protein